MEEKSRWDDAIWEQVGGGLDLLLTQVNGMDNLLQQLCPQMNLNGSEVEQAVNEQEVPVQSLDTQDGLGLQQRAPAVCFVPQVFVGMSQESRQPMLEFMSHSEVVWDEELQHMFDDQHDLLKELAQGGERHVGENRFTVKGPMDEPTLNTGAPMLLELRMASVDVMYDEMPQLDVVWDDEECEIIKPNVQLAINEELEQSDEEMANLIQCKQDANNGVFDELSSKVVWDDDLLQGVESHDILLDLVVHGEHSVGMNSKPMAEPISCKASVEINDVSGELFGERPAWDEDPQHDSMPLDDTLQQLLWGDVSLDVALVVEPLTKDFQVISSVGCSYLDLEETHAEGIIEQLAFCSKDTKNTTEHSGLLQQLAWGREASDSEMGQPELVCEEFLTNVCSSTVSIHSDLQLCNQDCKLEFFVDAYLMDIKHKQVYICIRQWDPEFFSSQELNYDTDNLVIWKQRICRTDILESLCLTLSTLQNCNFEMVQPMGPWYLEICLLAS